MSYTVEFGLDPAGGGLMMALGRAEERRHGGEAGRDESVTIR